MFDKALESRLRRHVETLAGDIGVRNVFRYDALQSAARYIRDEWRDQGYEVNAQSYDVNGKVCENLEVTCRGSNQSSEIILVGAHYDTVHGSPGADDNASGVAGLLEIGRFLSQAHPEKTVRLVAFVNEEPPFFFWKQMGSLVYAKAAKARGDRIRLMISLEMLGCYSEHPGSQTYPPLLKYFYPDRGDFIAFVANFASMRLMRLAAGAFRAHSEFPLQTLVAPQWTPGVAASDHLSFWRQGFRAMMVTDTAYYRYGHYHRPTDTADRLHYPAMARVVAGLRETVAVLAR